MSNEPLSIGLAARHRPGLLRALGPALFSGLLSVAPASAQSGADGSGAPDDLSALYDCASYYTVVNHCYSHDPSEASRRLSAVAFENRDKVIHLIYVGGRRAGVLPETSQSGMSSSFSRMMDSIDHQCQKLAKLTASLRASCDKMIEDVPKQPYDGGQKSGSLESAAPTSIE